MISRAVGRSRSPRPIAAAPSPEAQEAILSEFARVYWELPDSDEQESLVGNRATRVQRFRERLVTQVEAATRDFDVDPELGLSRVSKDTVARWQRFTFFEDLARMSDVLFRGPMDPRHADDIDLRLHCAWRRLQVTALDPDEFSCAVSKFRVSAVRLAMMLETARPPEASRFDSEFKLPDARTLASLLSLRCEKDDPDELMEMYRLVCHKLHGVTCTWCCQPFDEGSSAGLFDGTDTLIVPATIPKVFVPQCGHAVHALCFGSQVIPDELCQDRGYCRRCGLQYAWTFIDVDPMVNAFCLLFGPYVDKRAADMRALGEISRGVVLSIAEVCRNFSQELCGLVSATSAWVLLVRRHDFSDLQTVHIIGEEVLRLLDPVPEAPLQPGCADVVDVEDQGSQSCDEDGSGVSDSDRHITEIFLPEQEAEEARELPPVPSDDFDNDEDPPMSEVTPMPHSTGVLGLLPTI